MHHYDKKAFWQIIIPFILLSLAKTLYTIFKKHFITTEVFIEEFCNRIFSLATRKSNGLGFRIIGWISWISEWDYWLWIMVYSVLGNTTFRIWELNVAVTTSQRVSTVTHLFALQLKYICECDNRTKIFLKSNLNSQNLKNLHV